MKAVPSDHFKEMQIKEMQTIVDLKQKLPKPAK
jgi:hypothetical protein